MKWKWACLSMVLLAGCARYHLRSGTDSGTVTGTDTGVDAGTRAPDRDASSRRPDAARDWDGGEPDSGVVGQRCRMQIYAEGERWSWIEWTSGWDGRLLSVLGNPREHTRATAEVLVLAWDGIQPTLVETTDRDAIRLDASRMQRFEYHPDGRPIMESSRTTPRDPREYTVTLRYEYESGLLREIIEEIDGVARLRWLIEVDLVARRAIMREHYGSEIEREETLEWNPDGTIHRTIYDAMDDLCAVSSFVYDAGGFVIARHDEPCPGTDFIRPSSRSYVYEELPDRIRFTARTTETGRFSHRMDWMHAGEVRGFTVRQEDDGPATAFDEETYGLYTGCSALPVHAREAPEQYLDLRPFRLAGVPLVEEPPLWPQPPFNPFISREL